MRLLYTIIFFLCFSNSWSQVGKPLIQKKRFSTKNQIILDSVGINPSFFKILDSENNIIHDSLYEIDYDSAILILKNNIQKLDTITVQYLKFPDFMTRTYKQLQ